MKRLENTWDLEGNVACGEWICRRVGHVRRRAMWENLLFSAIFYTRGHFLPKGDRNLMFFTLISGSPFRTGIPRKIEYGRLKHRGERGSKFRVPNASRTPCDLIMAFDTVKQS